MHAFLPTPRIDGRLAGAAAVSASLRLEDLLRRSHTRPLVRLPTSQVLFGSKVIHSIDNAWCSGKQDENQFLNKWVLSSRISRRNFVNGNLWSAIRLATNVVVFAAQMATWGKLTLWGAKINSLILEGQYGDGHFSLPSRKYWISLESGSPRFLAIYFSSILTSSAMNYNFCKAPALGASGAIFGLVGSFAVFVIRDRNLMGDGREELRHIAYVIALNMVIGIASKGVDNWGHVIFLPWIP